MHGTPARYARMLRNRALGNMALVGAVSVPVSLWWAEDPLSAWRGGVAFLAAAVVLATVYDLSGAYKRAYVGIVSEQRVLDVIKQADVDVVVNGARISDRSGDIDHIVLGPVAAVIETKTGAGTVTVQGDQLRLNARTLKGASLRKVRSQAQALSQLIGADAAPVVCVVDMDGEPQQVGDVTICAADSLPQVLDQLPRVSDISKMQEAVSAITERKGTLKGTL